MAETKVLVYRKQPYTVDDWYITTTPTNRKTVRWTHNHRAIETFCGYTAEKRANRFIEFLIKQLNDEREQFIKEAEGK